MRHHLGYFLIVLALFLGLLGWIGHVRQQDFHANHLATARESAAIAAVEIARFIEEKQRLVELFARDNQALILAVARAQNDESLHQELASRVTDYFPDHFTFTVTDAQGRLLKDDFDGLVGELCLSDLREFLSSGRQQPRIHPHAEKYHFDVLAALGRDGDHGVFFVSFHADILGRQLKAIQNPGHQLILVYPDAGDLIEVTSDGARINWPRDDYRLSPGEKQRILHRRSIPGMRWEVVDLHAPSLFADYRKTLYTHTGVIFAGFLLVNLVMLYYLNRAERQRRAAETTIRQMAFHDELTRLPNRRLFLDRLRRAMDHSGRSGRHAALMFLDLDNFKILNDTHGHDVGDLLLREVAGRIGDSLRTDDSMARFGGDEFVVLLENLAGDSAAAADQCRGIGEKLLSALAEPYRLSAQRDGGQDVSVEHRCTSSIGVVLFKGHDRPQEDLLRLADEAMYAAKQAGRNQIRFADAAEGG